MMESTRTLIMRKILLISKNTIISVLPKNQCVKTLQYCKDNNFLIFFQSLLQVFKAQKPVKIVIADNATQYSGFYDSSGLQDHNKSKKNVSLAA